MVRSRHSREYRQTRNNSKRVVHRRGRGPINRSRDRAGDRNGIMNGNRPGHRNNAESRRLRLPPSLPQRQHDPVLDPVNVSKNSIHSAWKRELGGLVRYYIHQRTRGASHTSGRVRDHDRGQGRGRGRGHVNTKDAELEIERMYYQSGCSVQGTKDAILKALCTNVNVNVNDWITMSIAVEKESVDEEDNKKIKAALHMTIDRKGIQLPQIRRPGEGPAHAHETWNTVVVPSWAVGKPYFFQMNNNSPIPLSCEMTLDGNYQHKVAKNAPLPIGASRTLRPDSSRYFEEHKWVFQAAKRVKLQDAVLPDTILIGDQTRAQLSNHGRASMVRVKADPVSPVRNKCPQRYNGIRPNYQQRVSLEQYPDPTSMGYGWNFTGSTAQSRVEFYEKSTNMGIIKLDFYYTTATVKTVLEHPTTGLNQLFRNTVSPEEYVKILENPRAHTGRGYRTRSDRPNDADVEMERGGNGDDNGTGNPDMNMVENGNDDRANKSNNEEFLTDASSGVDENSATFFAKNDDYNFKMQGHSNRREEMRKLHQSNEYSQWEQAAKMDWAVAHAKFYISIPQHQHGHAGGSRRNVYNSRHSHSHNDRIRGGGGRNRRNLENLPEQQPVIDLKASEKATLGTKFQAIPGRQNNKNQYRSMRRSAVKMKRIQGLTDTDEWRGGPVFECKLYYRAEDVISPSLDDATDVGDDMSMEQSMGDAENAASQLELVEESLPSIDTYKIEKINQVKQYHVENMAASSPEEAEEMLETCQSKVRLCDNVRDIDELVKIYYSNIVKGQFYGSAVRNAVL